MFARIGLFALLFVGGGCADSSGQCLSDDQCGPTLICVDARCVAPCTDDAVCGEGALCLNGRCAVGCVDNDGCPLEQLCREGLCVNGCDSNDRCAAYQYCSEQGQCLEGCGRDGDCGAGQFCESNKCVPILRTDAGVRACQDHESCLVGEYCAPDGTCRVGCRPGTCGRQEQCDENTGQCVAQGGGASDAGPPAPGDAGPVAPSCWLQVGGEVVDSLNALAEGRLVAANGRSATWQPVNPQADGPALLIEDDSLIGLRVGSYEIEGLVQSGNLALRCVVAVEVVPPLGYWLELSWDGDRDLDLHMVPIPNQEPCDSDRICANNNLRRTECNLGYCSRGFGSSDGRDGDCWARNRNPSWSDPNDRRSDPHYLIDVREGAGTEYIRVDALSRGWTYPVALRAWGNQPNTASFKLFRDGLSVGEQLNLNIAPARPNGWLYLGRLSTEGYEPVLRQSVEAPRD